MIKKLGMLVAFTSLFSLTPALSQTCTTPMDSDSGSDNDDVTVSVTDFSCVSGVTGAYISGISINTTIGSNCTNWYSHTLEVDGDEIASGLCGGTHDLADFGIYDFNSIENITIVSKDEDDFAAGDDVDMSIEAVLTYITPDCPPPGYFNVSTLGSTTADLDWTPNGSESFWQIELVDITAGDTATGVATTLGIVTDSTQLTGLTPENDYAVYVRANCISGTPPASTWIGPLTFTTHPTCFPMTGADITDVIDVSALAFWPTIEDAWEIELVDITAGNSFLGNPTETGITDTSYSFTGLTPDNKYSYKVRANCGVVDGMGDWSDAVEFTTDPSCIQPSDFTLTAISTSTIDIVWVSNDTETSYAIDLVNVDNGETFSATADFVVLTDTHYTITGLSPNTTYDVFVSSICSATDTSAWTSLGLNTTLCLPLTLPYVDSLNTWVSDCYSLSNSGTTNNWSSFGSDGVIQANSNDFASGQVIFTMGGIDMTSQSTLSFDWSSAAENEQDNWVSVEFSIDNGTSWFELWKKVGNDLSSNDGANFSNPGSFITENILLPDSTVGELVNIRFVNYFTSWDNEFFLDLIKVDTLPDCNPAYNIALDTVISGVPTFSFTDIAGDNSVSWDYEITSGGPTITGNTTTTPFDVSGLTPGVNYTMTLNTLCSADSMVSNEFQFSTPCAPVSYYAEDFESYIANEIPNCWSNITVSGGFGLDNDIATFTGFNSTNSWRFGNGSNPQTSDYILAITPELLNTSTSWMKLRHMTSSIGNNELIIGKMTDYTDESTFVGLDTVQATQNVWNEHIFKPQDFADFSGDRIALRANISGSWRSMNFDDFIYEEIPTCYYPDNVTIDSTTLDGVYATIDPYNTTDAVWEVEFVNLSTGETFTGTPTDTVNTSVFYADGLESSSLYEMYIRTDCGTETSIWSLAYTFTTKCAPVSDFEQGWETGTTCWTLNLEATTTFAANDLLTNPVNGGSFTNRLYNSSSAAGQTHIYTASPELTNLDAGTHWLTFFGRNRFSWSSPATVEVGTMTDPDDASSFNLLHSFVMTASYEKYEYSLVGYTGTDKYVAYRLADNAGTFRRAVIDDVVWEEAPECSVPMFLTPDSVTDITGMVDWTPFSADSAWQIEIVNISAGGSFTGIATDSSETHPYTFTGLTQNTTYGVKVRNYCDTNWSVETLFTTLTSFDIEVSNFVNLGPNGCQLTTTEQAMVTITNYGAQAATSFDVYYSLDGITYTNDGTFTGTILPGEDTIYTLANLFDFSTADTTLFIATSLMGDTIYMDNDSNSIQVINNGDATLNLEVTTGAFSTEISWSIVDTTSGTNVASFNSYFSNFTSTNHTVCVNVGTVYSMVSFDSFGDGWNGGTYEITQCAGVLIANNNGDSPSTAPHTGGFSMEAQEYFSVEECDDYDLAILSMDSLESGCGLSASEQAYLSVKNFGLLDITPSLNAEVQYLFNGSSWTTLADIENLASGADTLLALPTVNMLTPLSYTFEYKVVYALDQNSTNDSLDMEIESVGTYTDVDQNLNDSKSGWTPHIISGTSHSWEWGVPTTTLIGTGVTGKAWVTKLDLNMNLNEESYLLSPCFDLSGYTDDAEISFDFIWTSSTTGHSVRFQSSIDGGSTWGTIETMPINTTSWTNKSVLSSTVSGESDVKFRFFMDNTWNTDAEGFGLDNFKVLEHVAYTDTTLMDLTVNGTTIPGFDPTIFDYTFEYPYGSTAAQFVDATENAPFIESLTITQAPSLPGMATVVVIAEDTNYQATYTVDFVEGPADSNAYLSDLTVNTATVTGFDSLTMSYNVALPFGTTAVVPVSWTTSSSDATATIVNANPLPGATVVTVVAQDGVTTNDYTINFTVEPGDSISSLSDLSVDGVTVLGFHEDTLNYTVESLGSTAVVGYVTTSTNATGVLSNPNPQNVPSTVFVTVTAQDGSSTVYTINLVEPTSDNAYLISLEYEVVSGSGFVSVAGFDSTVFVYNETIPFGSNIPTVQYEVSDTNSTVSIVNPLVLPGATVVTVTAQDGSILTYTINWDVTTPSTNSALATLDLEWATVLTAAGGNLFDPFETHYNAYITDALYLANCGPLTMIPLDADAVATTTSTVFPAGSSHEIKCTAQSGDTTIYYINIIQAIGQEELEDGTVSVYPNPSTGIFNVVVKDIVTDFSIEVVNATGQKVFSNDYKNNNENVSVDLSTYADGLYHVVVKDSKTGLSTKKKISILK